MSLNKEWKLILKNIARIHQNLLKELSPNYVYKNIGAPLIFATYLALKKYFTERYK